MTALGVHALPVHAFPVHVSAVYALVAQAFLQAFGVHALFQQGLGVHALPVHAFLLHALPVHALTVHVQRLGVHAYQWCTPSRTAFISGRLPIHIARLGGACLAEGGGLSHRPVRQVGRGHVDPRPQ